MITSVANPLVKRVKRLRQKKYRLEEQAYFIEGLRVVLTAVEQNAPLEQLIVAPALLTSEVGRQAVSRQQRQGRPVVEVAPAVFRALSERDHPAGLGAIVRSAWRDPARLPPTPDALYVALVEVADPGNLGTILRTLDATAGNGLILVGPSTEPFQGSVAKASMGALYTVPVCRLPDTAALFTWTRARNLPVIAAAARATASFGTVVYPAPALLLLGSEGEGLPAAVVQQADLAVSIPMSGSVSSLNLAVAAALLLYEMRRER